MARISCIVANYNYGEYILRTIDSLLNQTINSEIIVVDDGSTDDSLKVLAQYDGKIKVIALSHNGQSSACNEAFRQAEGQYIVRVDSDDYVNSKMLDIESLFLEENKDFDAVACDYYKVDERGNRLERVSSKKEPIACGVMFRKELLYDTGLYDDNVTIWEEREFMDRFLKKYTVYHIPLPLYRYFQHEGSLTHADK